MAAIPTWSFINIAPEKLPAFPKKERIISQPFFFAPGASCKTSGVYTMPIPAERKLHPQSSSRPPKTWHASARRARARIARTNIYVKGVIHCRTTILLISMFPWGVWKFFFKEDFTFWITVLDSMFNIAVLTILAQSFLMKHLQYQRAFY